MNNRDILRIAMEQSAVDMNCNAEDFQKDKNVLVYLRELMYLMHSINQEIDLNG